MAVKAEGELTWWEVILCIPVLLVLLVGIGVGLIVGPFAYGVRAGYLMFCDWAGESQSDIDRREVMLAASVYERK